MNPQKSSYYSLKYTGQRLALGLMLLIMVAPYVHSLAQMGNLKGQWMCVETMEDTESGPSSDQQKKIEKDTYLLFMQANFRIAHQENIHNLLIKGVWGLPHSDVADIATPPPRP